MAELNSFFPTGEGVFTFDQPLVSPWFIPGWTSQDATEPQFEIPAGEESLTGPGFPHNLSFGRVTHKYFDPNSSGIAGFLTVFMSDGINVTDGSETVTMPQRLAGTMNIPVSGLAYNNWGNGILYIVTGFLDITLFCTDQGDNATVATNLGQPFTYWVIEHFMGGCSYQITVPSASAPGPVDIRSLAVAGTIQPYAYDPVNPMGQTLIPIPPPSF
jgi:hypothetical protein